MVRFRFVTNKTLRTWHHDPKTFYQMLQFNRLVQIKRSSPSKSNTHIHIYIYYIYPNIQIMNKSTLSIQKLPQKKSTHQLQAISIVFMTWKPHHLSTHPNLSQTTVWNPKAPPAGPKLVDRNAPRRHETPRVVGFLWNDNRESRRTNHGNCRWQFPPISWRCMWITYSLLPYEA